MIEKIASAPAFRGYLFLPVQKQKGMTIPVKNFDSNDIQEITIAEDGNTMINVLKKGFDSEYYFIPQKEVPVLAVIAAYNAVKDNNLRIDLTNYRHHRPGEY